MGIFLDVMAEPSRIPFIFCVKESCPGSHRALGFLLSSYEAEEYYWETETGGLALWPLSEEMG